MGTVLEVVSGRVTNPGATITAVTANTGDSFAVRNFDPGAGAYMLSMWARSATAGVARVRSPRLHDNQQGYRARIPATNSDPVWPLGAKQVLYAQDTLILEQSGGGAETDSMSILNYYSDLKGSDANLVTWESVKDRIEDMVTIETAHTTGTAGDYGGQLALNAGVADLLIANRYYAVLGFLTDTQVTTIGLRGPDTANFRVGCPGTLSRQFSEYWFRELSVWTGLPCIPVINSANKAGTLVDLVHNTGAATVNINTVLALLKA